MSPAVPGQIRYPKIEKTKCVMKILFTSQEIFNQLLFPTVLYICSATSSDNKEKERENVMSESHFYCF